MIPYLIYFQRGKSVDCEGQISGHLLSALQAPYPADSKHFHLSCDFLVVKWPMGAMGMANSINDSSLCVKIILTMQMNVSSDLPQHVSGEELHFQFPTLECALLCSGIVEKDC